MRSKCNIKKHTMYSSRARHAGGRVIIMLGAVLRHFCMSRRTGWHGTAALAYRQCFFCMSKTPLSLMSSPCTPQK